MNQKPNDQTNVPRETAYSNLLNSVEDKCDNADWRRKSSVHCPCEAQTSFTLTPPLNTCAKTVRTRLPAAAVRSHSSPETTTEIT